MLLLPSVPSRDEGSNVEHRFRSLLDVTIDGTFNVMLARIWVTGDTGELLDDE